MVPTPRGTLVKTPTMHLDEHLAPEYSLPTLASPRIVFDFLCMEFAAFGGAIGGATCRGCSERDIVLAQLWESHPIRLEVSYTIALWVDLTEARSWVESLLPEVSMRGIAGLSGKNDRSIYRVARKSASVRVHRLLDGGWTMAS